MKTRGLMMCAWVTVAFTACASQSDEQQEQRAVDPRDGERYVWIPPGSFQMGCSPDDRVCQDEEHAFVARFANEKPRHRVVISNGFWMGQTEVTISAYRKHAKATGAKVPEELVLAVPERFRFQGFPQGDHYPMVYVTWDEAARYCRWARGRLPTEAEWEFAARAGSPAAGYGKVDEIAWYADNSGPSKIDSNELWETASSPAAFEQRLRDAGNDTHPVGTKTPNKLGLYDMLGNVWEHTADWYGDTYYKVSEVRDPGGPLSGEFWVMRGGSWRSRPQGVRVSIRAWMLPDHRFGDIGFRCVREAIP